MGLDHGQGLDAATRAEQSGQAFGAGIARPAAAQAELGVGGPPVLQRPLGQGRDRQPAAGRQESREPLQRRPELREPLHGQAGTDQIEARGLQVGPLAVHDAEFGRVRADAGPARLQHPRREVGDQPVRAGKTLAQGLGQESRAAADLQDARPRGQGQGGDLLGEAPGHRALHRRGRVVGIGCRIEGFAHASLPPRGGGIEGGGPREHR